jgi:hypothetical protein
VSASSISHHLCPSQPVCWHSIGGSTRRGDRQPLQRSAWFSTLGCVVNMARIYAQPHVSFEFAQSLTLSQYQFILCSGELVLWFHHHRCLAQPRLCLTTTTLHNGGWCCSFPLPLFSPAHACRFSPQPVSVNISRPCAYPTFFRALTPSTLSAFEG